MHAVLDTNTLISGLLWTGAPHTLLAHWIPRGELVMCTSPALISELHRVLTYPHIAQKAAALGLDTHALMSVVLSHAEIYEDVPPLNVIKEDPSDNEVLAVALIADADAIISGDQHLRKLKSFMGIRILTASEALRELRKGSSAA